MKIKNWLFSSFLLTVVLAVFWFNTNQVSVPDLTFVTITGKKIVLKELKGKPVIVSFWSIDCTGCLKEIPHLISLYEQYHKRGLEIIAIPLPYNPPNLVVELSKEHNVPYNVVLDLKGDYAIAFGGIEFTPSTFLISPDGKIISRIIGVFDFENMKTTIETLLKG